MDTREWWQSWWTRKKTCPLWRGDPAVDNQNHAEIRPREARSSDLEIWSYLTFKCWQLTQILDQHCADQRNLYVGRCSLWPPDPAIGRHKVHIPQPSVKFLHQPTPTPPALTLALSGQLKSRKGKRSVLPRSHSHGRLDYRSIMSSN